MGRISVDAAGALVVGPGPGRGAWLCEDSDCFRQAERRRAFGRALRADVKAGEIARLQESWPVRPGADPGRTGRVGPS